MVLGGSLGCSGMAALTSYMAQLVLHPLLPQPLLAASQGGGEGENLQGSSSGNRHSDIRRFQCMQPPTQKEEGHNNLDFGRNPKSFPWCFESKSKHHGSNGSESQPNHVGTTPRKSSFAIRAPGCRQFRVIPTSSWVDTVKRSTPGQEMAVMGMLMSNKRSVTNFEGKAGQAEQIVGEHGGEAPEKKGRFGDAMKVANSPTLLDKAVESLKGNFWASSSLKARKSRREEVLTLAVAVSKEHKAVIPLSREVIEKTAAALKGASLASADQYLNELKLMHVEAGFEVPAWMQRTFTLCKKALMRNRGPTKRAPELCLNKMPAGAWNYVSKKPKQYCRPMLAFAWGVVWMLREVELGAVKWNHVEMNEESRTITVYIPKSKMDQMGKGVKRSLQCSGESPCARHCVWELLALLKKEKLANQREDDYVFVDNSGNRVSKSNMIKSWTEASGQRVSGHSARRSGAMLYTRLGLPVQELAFLGRWKSSVVLSYAEEALEEMAANKRITERETHKSKHVLKTMEKKTERSTQEVLDSLSSLVKQEVQNNVEAVNPKRPLWVATNNYRSRDRIGTR